MHARRALHGFAFALVLALPIAEGCSGDDAAVNSSNDGGGGDDGSTIGDSSATGDGNSNQDTSTTDAFCAAANDLVSRCALTDACSLAVAAACTSTEANANPAFLAAYEACESLQPCPGPGVTPDGGKAAYDSCLASHFGGPDTAEQTLATDFCAKCIPASGSCATGFYADPKAARLLELDDAIVTEIDNTCVKSDAGADDGGFVACGDAFTKCARKIIDAHDPPPAACNDR